MPPLSRSDCSDQPIKDSGERTSFATGSVRDRKTGKGRYDLLPFYAIQCLAQHFEKGAQKYGERNWEKGQPLSNYLDSACRHLHQFMAGQRDEPHLVSALWNIACCIETAHWVEDGTLPSALDDLEDHANAQPSVDYAPARECRAEQSYADQFENLTGFTPETELVDEAAATDPYPDAWRVDAGPNGSFVGGTSHVEIIDGVSEFVLTNGKRKSNPHPLTVYHNDNRKFPGTWSINLLPIIRFTPYAELREFNAGTGNRIDRTKYIEFVGDIGFWVFKDGSRETATTFAEGTPITLDAMFERVKGEMAIVTYCNTTPEYAANPPWSKLPG